MDKNPKFISALIILAAVCFFVAHFILSYQMKQNSMAIDQLNSRIILLEESYFYG